MSEPSSPTESSAKAGPLERRLLILRLWVLRHLTPTETAITLFWAGLVGVGGALLAVGFRLANQKLQSFFFLGGGKDLIADDGKVQFSLSTLFSGNGQGLLSSAAQLMERMPPGVGPVLVGVIPAVGGLLAGCVLLFAQKFTRGKKAPDLLEAVTIRDGKVPFRFALVKSISSLISLSSGASLGREGAIAQLSAAWGSRLGQWHHASPQRLRLLVGCGVASGIAAAYNAPIAGALFVTEILLGNFAMEIFGPVVFASVISTVISRSVFGMEPVFGHVKFEMASPWELVSYLIFGLLCGLAAPGFRAGLKKFKQMFDKLGWSLPARLAAGGFIVGGIAIFVPGVLGNGYEAANKILSENPVWTWVAWVLVFKVVATFATMGSGAAGGVFTPTLFVGAALGFLFGHTADVWMPFPSAEPGAYALVGMGAVLAGTTHAPLMAILMVFEMSLDYAVILPLMVCCVISSFMSRRIWRESIYSEPLREQGEAWRTTPEAMVMTSTRVSEVMNPNVQSVPRTARFAEVVDFLFKRRRQNVYVVDETGRFLGAISIHDIKELLHARDDLSFVIAHDLMNPNFPVVTPDEPLAAVFDEFWQMDCERLPVVENLQSRKLVGTISKRDIMGVYGREILDKEFLLTRLSQRSARGSTSRYLELPEPYTVAEIKVGDSLNGKRVGEIELAKRFGLLALMVKRVDGNGKETGEIVSASQELQRDDWLFVIGTIEDIERFKQSHT